MKVLNHWKLFPQSLRGGVLCVGNFDGVHLGHARMLSTGKAQALSRNVPFTIMTFDPHPSVLLNPANPRVPLTTREQRLELLGQFQPDALIVIPTDWAFLSVTDEQFLKEIVRGDAHSGLGAKMMVEGQSFTYGKGAKGTVETLKIEGPPLGIEAMIVPTVEQGLGDLTLVKVSSSLIRWLVGQGRVVDAAKALGRPYTLRGTVVKGQQRGRTIGFPTANLGTTQLLPAPGIYAGTAKVDGTVHGAAISVGNNPTFAGTVTTVEAFLLDYSGDLYGKTMDLSFCGWVREMLTFSGVEPLVRQMHRDVALARTMVTLKESA